MKLRLFLFLCFTGVPVPMQAARNEYYLITTPSTWADAKTYCRSNFVDLAMMKTSDDWYWLIAEAQDIGIVTPAWVGMYINVVLWFWSNSVVQVLDSTLASWSPGQPDNFGGNELCCAIDSGGLWADYDCDLLKPFICYTASPFAFHAYNTPQTFWQSYDVCIAQHTGFAAANTSAQNTELKQIAENQGTSWFGLFRDPWLWADGFLALDVLWGPGLPNNIELNDNCGAINNSMAIDRQCDHLFHFFCYKTFTVKYQVMEMLFHGDGSVFDPVVQSTILQQIIQKLKIQGMTRKIKVTWRVHPDGNIFHKKWI